MGVSAKRAALLSFCRSLPQVTEDVKWGNDLVFSVGKKMFCGFTNDGKDATFGCKVPEEDFATITSVDGITPAKYAARYHWVSVDDPDVLPEAEARRMIRGSYDLVKAGLPKKLQAQIDGEAASPATARSAGPPKRGATTKKKERKAKAKAPRDPRRGNPLRDRRRGKKSTSARR